jgi:Ran-binding protein 3
LSSFAKPGASTIVGLSKKPNRPFGAAGDAEKENSGDEEEGGDDQDAGSDNEASDKAKISDSKKVNLTPPECKPS